MAGSNGISIALALGGGAAVFAAIVAVVPQQGVPPETAVAPAADAAAPAPEVAASDDAVQAAPAEPTGEAAVAVEPEATLAGTENATAESPAIEAPRVDTFRVEPDGLTVVAGRAAPEVLIAVLVDSEIVGEDKTDAVGGFTVIADLPPSAVPRVLSVVADPAGAAVMSEQTYIVAPTPEAVAEAETGAAQTEVPDEVADGGAAGVEAPADEVAAEEVAAAADVAPDSVATVPEVAPAPGEPAAEDASEQVADAGSAAAAAETPAAEAATESAQAVASEPAAEAPADGTVVTAPQEQTAPDQPAPAVVAEAPGLGAPEPGETAAPPVIVSDAQGVRLVQPALAPGAGPEVLTTVAVDAIAYDAQGRVSLSGRAAGGGMVRLYLDNAPLTDVAVDARGQWAADLTDVAAGVYTLRVDQIDAGGRVTSRVETPFLREERESIAAAMADDMGEEGFAVAMKTVQPGNTLWAIARERYGEGVLYLQVFEANRDRIRDADLIYPGQVFVLPEIGAGDGAAAGEPSAAGE